MGVFDKLGPTWKAFEDLEPGDYLFEIQEPNERGWTIDFVDEDNKKATMTMINWRLRVISPESSAGRVHSHLTMYDASPQKIAKAKKAYDPTFPTKAFLKDIGIGVVQDGMVIVQDDYCTDGEPDPDKMIGFRFNGSIRKGTNPKQPDRVGLAEAWPE